MSKEYKTLYFEDTEAGREKLTAKINELAQDGWVLKSKETTERGWNIGKTFWLGILFLPLALKGKKENLIQVIMERDKK